MTLPTPTGIPSGMTFVGWTTTTVTNSTTAPTYYSAGKTYTINSSLTLKALFKYTTTSGSGNVYTKVTTAPSNWAGTYVIVYEAESMILNGSLSNPDTASNYKTVSISGSSITASTAVNNCAVTITAVSGGYTIRTASGYYIGRTSNTNGMNKSSSTKYVNTISLLSDDTVNIKGNGGAYLRFNTTSGQDRFRYFKSTTYSSQKPICLYKLSGGSSSSATYYTTNP